MSKVETMAEAKTRLADRKYKDLVMQTFDDFEHRNKRAQLEKRAEVEAAARDRL